jgi:hypothetical protein
MKHDYNSYTDHTDHLSRDEHSALREVRINRNGGIAITIEEVKATRWWRAKMQCLPDQIQAMRLDLGLIKK